MTYAHSIQTILLPRVINGSAMRHFADFLGEYAIDQPAKTFMDELVGFTPSGSEQPDEQDAYNFRRACSICPSEGAPAIECYRHGYIYSRAEYEEEGEYSYFMDIDEYWLHRDIRYCDDCGDFSPNVHCYRCGDAYDFEKRYSHEYYGYSSYYDDNFPYGDADEVEASYHEIAEFYDSYLRVNEPIQPEPWWWYAWTRHNDAKHMRAFREAISRSPSHRRRDLSIHKRGNRKDYEDRSFREAYLKLKHAEY